MPMTSASGVSPAGSHCPAWARWLRCWPGDPQLMAPLETLLRQLSGNGTFGPQVAFTHRAHPMAAPPVLTPGSPTGTVKRSAAICARAIRLSIAGGQHPRSRALVTAVRLLTRSPDRFAAPPS